MPERFTLFSLLIENSPCFVKEDDIVNRVYYSDLTGEKTKAVGMLISRLRRDLGDTLAGRIQNQRGVGWAYVPPYPEETGPR
ncbi:MAG: helix-turn-helix domain-containing protein [Elusimicrobiota bacterium]|nr:helix-turn-helix domain-containing protein [Elusimicrobiota bacterium]